MSNFFPISTKKKYYPYSDFNDILDSIFPKWSDASWTAPRALSNSAYVNSPPCNILKDESGFEIALAVPGYSRDDFTIDIDKDVLSISMKQHNAGVSDVKNSYLSRGFDYSSFSKSWSLPEGVEFDSISARYDAGILTINIPVEKQESAKRRVTVS